MENLIFSLNIVLPVFLIILAGYLLKEHKTLSEGFRSSASTLVFYYALPAQLFLDVAESNIRETFNAKFVFYAMGTVTIVFLISWFLCTRFLKDRSQISAAVHGSFRGNFAYIGLAVCHNLLPDIESLTASIMVITFVIPLYNVLATIVLSYYDPSGKKPTVKSQLLALVKNPLIISILAGIPFSVFHISIPFIATKALGYMGQLSTPMALLLIGANLQPETFTKKPAGIFIGTFVKIALSPLVFTLLAIPLHFTTEELVTLFTMHAVPSAANSYIMTQKMGGDAELGAGIVTASSLLSVFTMAFGIFLLRTFGLV